MLSLSLKGLLTAAVAYGCYALLLFFMQRMIMFPGRSIQVPSQPPPIVGREIVRLTAPVAPTEAWFLPAVAGEGRRPLVLFFHGNGEVIDDLPGQTTALQDIGLHVLLVEYPGYGRSSGTPTETGITAVAVAAYDAAAKRPDVDPSRIIAFGRSLGAGAACALSRQRPLAALVLQSPFTSTRPFARQFLLPAVLVRDVFDNLAAVRSFDGPLLVAHGRHDDIIPFRHGKELAAAAPRGRLLPLDCSHNDCPPDEAAFWRRVTEWLGESGVLARSARGLASEDNPGILPPSHTAR